MSRESHFNSILNNSRAAEIFFEVCAVAFGSLSWESAYVEPRVHTMNCAGVCTVHHCRNMDMGRTAWKIFKKIIERVVVSLRSVGLFESNKLAQVIDEGEPRIAFLSPNKP